MIVRLHKWFIIYAAFLSIGINYILIRIEDDKVVSNLLESLKSHLLIKGGDARNIL